MAWEDEMVAILRVLVADNDSETYDDDTLEKNICVAAFQVLRELPFSQVFSVSVSDQTLSPDPTVGATKDDSFVNLVTQKAACITDRGSAMKAAGQAIAVKDGASAIDLRSIVESKLKVLKIGWCAVYDDTKLEYQSGAYGIAGACVMTPFRTYLSGDGRGWYTTVPGRDRTSYDGL